MLFAKVRYARRKDRRLCGAVANSFGMGAAVMKVANTSASSHALRSSTRRNSTANPTTRNARGYESWASAATERARVLVSPAPCLARNEGVKTKGCDCPGRRTVRVTVSPGCDLSHVRFSNPFHADAEYALLPLIATMRSFVFNPAFSAGLFECTSSISTPAEE